MDKALHEEYEVFCKARGISKVRTTEQAIRQYMDKMNKALKNVTPLTENIREVPPQSDAHE